MQMYKRVYRNGDAKGELFRKEKGDKTLMMCTVQYELDSHTCLMNSHSHVFVCPAFYFFFYMRYFRF